MINEILPPAKVVDDLLKPNKLDDAAIVIQFLNKNQDRKLNKANKYHFEIAKEMLKLYCLCN